MKMIAVIHIYQLSIADKCNEIEKVHYTSVLCDGNKGVCSCVSVCLTSVQSVTGSSCTWCFPSAANTFSQVLKHKKGAVF